MRCAFCGGSKGLWFVFKMTDEGLPPDRDPEVDTAACRHHLAGALEDMIVPGDPNVFAVAKVLPE